jgi:hypothetical protein
MFDHVDDHVMAAGLTSLAVVHCDGSLVSGSPSGVATSEGFSLLAD